MDRNNRIIKSLKQYIQFPTMELKDQNQKDYELLIAVVLSAQCTDKKVNEVTPKLFKKYPSIESFANANEKDLQEQIKSITFFRNKSKNIISACKKIIEDHNGKVPKTFEEINNLAGCGRKTTNVLMSCLYNEPSIVVDTHVSRVSKRLNWTTNKNPDKIEIDLKKIIEEKDWNIMSDILILFGRYTCKARNPRCYECPIKDICDSKQIKPQDDKIKRNNYGKI